MAVPAAVETTASMTWTRRKPVGPWWNERGSFHMFRTNVGHMTHVHTPKDNRNSEAGRESLMTESLCAYGPARAPGYVLTVRAERAERHVDLAEPERPQ
jgi:hypothetical protein